MMMFKNIAPQDDFGESITIATACIHSPSSTAASYSDRTGLLDNIITKAGKLADIIILPAGFYTTRRKPDKMYCEVENHIKDYLTKMSLDTTICFGIDGRGGKDQIGLAINKKGMISIARKFYPTIKEYNIKIADNHISIEDGISRIFPIKDRNFYLAICYDSYGIRKKHLSNPSVQGIINLVHRFDPFGEGTSGDVYFAKYGFAGSSKQWECPTFGATTFFKREIPDRWPTGVMWNQGEKSVQNWKYTDNGITQTSKMNLSYGSEDTLIKMYCI